MEEQFMETCVATVTCLPSHLLFHIPALQVDSLLTKRMTQFLSIQLRKPSEQYCSTRMATKKLVRRVRTERNATISAFTTGTNLKRYFEKSYQCCKKKCCRSKSISLIGKVVEWLRTGERLPLTFLLGFYVSLVVKR